MALGSDRAPVFGRIYDRFPRLSVRYALYHAEFRCRVCAGLAVVFVIVATVALLILNTNRKFAEEYALRTTGKQGM